MADISEDVILEVVRKHAADPATTIGRDTPIEDSGIDSYGLIEIVFELEERLGVDIPYNANDGGFADAKTVGDLIDKVAALVERA
jgi:acyl carrier protein